MENMSSDIINIIKYVAEGIVIILGIWGGRFVRKRKAKIEEREMVRLITRRQAKRMSKVIASTRKEIFISGFTLRLLSKDDVKMLLNSARRKRIKIRILLVNLNNDGLINAYEEMGGHKYIKLSHEKFNAFLRIKNVEIRRIDSIMPVDFVGSDMEERNGYIRAHHRFSHVISDLHPNVELTKIDKWYGFYRDQIETVWEWGKVWKGDNIENI